jgi:hypothetical protein
VNKYGLKFKHCSKGLGALLQWDKYKITWYVRESSTKQPKLTIIKDNYCIKYYKEELSPSQAL